MYVDQLIFNALFTRFVPHLSLKNYIICILKHDGALAWNTLAFKNLLCSETIMYIPRKHSWCKRSRVVGSPWCSSLMCTMEFSLNVFTEFAEFSDKKKLIKYKKDNVGLEPRISCVRDRDDTTRPQRQR